MPKGYSKGAVNIKTSINELAATSLFEVWVNLLASLDGKAFHQVASHMKHCLPLHGIGQPDGDGPDWASWGSPPLVDCTGDATLPAGRSCAGHTPCQVTVNATASIVLRT
jgi:hypothetical protein